MTYRLPRLAITSLLVAAPCTSVIAQRPSAGDSVTRHMWTNGMDSSRAYELAQVLLDSIGPRLTGTPTMKSAQDWLVRTYRSWGIDASNEEYGTWIDWRRGFTRVDLIAPQQRTLEATVQGYSPGTAGRDVVASTVVLPLVRDSSELLRWLPNAAGKFVLVAPGYPSCRTEYNWTQITSPEAQARMDTNLVRLVPGWRRRIIATNAPAPMNYGVAYRALLRRLDRAGAAGVIENATFNLLDALTVPSELDVNALWERGKNQKLPVVVMSCEDYGQLFRLTEHRQAPMIRLNSTAESRGEGPVFNTIATVVGRELPREYVMLSSHLDSFDGAAGAQDDGAGTIAMLEAMRILRSAYPKPKRTIIVGHWSSEEFGSDGSRIWAVAHSDVIAALQAVFHFDHGPGRVLYLGGAGYPDGGAHMQSWLSQLPDTMRSALRFAGLGSVPAPNGGLAEMGFSCAGAPLFQVIAPYAGPNYAHTTDDSFDKLVFDNVKWNATLFAMLAYLASEDPTFVRRDGIILSGSGIRLRLSPEDSMRFVQPDSRRIALRDALFNVRPAPLTAGQSDKQTLSCPLGRPSYPWAW